MGDIAEPLFHRKTTQAMNQIQVSAKDEFLARLERGEYRTEQTRCLFGASDDILLTDEDRYGIPFKTVICRQCGLMRAVSYYTRIKERRDYFRDEVAKVRGDCDRLREQRNFFREEAAQLRKRLNLQTGNMV